MNININEINTRIQNLYWEIEAAKNRVFAYKNHCRSIIRQGKIPAITLKRFFEAKEKVKNLERMMTILETAAKAA